MSTNRVAIDETKISVVQLEIHKPDIVSYFKRVPEGELTAAFIRAVEVGTFCLERANASQDLEFVRRQIESLISSVEQRVSRMPSEVESALMKRIGAGDGQVLAPIQLLVNQTARATSDRLAELKTMVNDVDPTKEGSAASRVVKNLKDLLDVNRTDSVQAILAAAVRGLTTADGVLAKTVQTTVEGCLKTVRDEIDSLAKEVRGQDAATEALNQTTAKGRTFEEEVVLGLQGWAQHVGAQLEHVGTDNRPGDVTVRFDEHGLAPLTIVIEARDRQSPKGRKAISDIMGPAMSERSAGAGIYLSRERQGLAGEIGDWAEGQCGNGCFVACTFEHLITAIRFLAVYKKLSDLRTTQQDVDGPTITNQLNRMRTALDRIKNINRKSNDIRGSAAEIESEAALLRSEIREALTTVEESIKSSHAEALIAIEGNGQKSLANA